MTFEAKFHGMCSECEGHISPGDQIRYQGSGEHRHVVHAACPEESTVTLRRNETVCELHFMVRPCPDCEA